MKNLYKILISLKLTIVLTYIIVAVTMAGSFVIIYHSDTFDTIDRSLLIDWIRQSGFSSSWWIIVLVSLVFAFALNTIFCTCDRLYSLFRSWRGRKIRSDEEEETLLTEDIRKGGGIRMRTFLPYIAHIGFLIALSGHLSGSIWGFRGDDIVAQEGEEVKIEPTKDISMKIGPMNMKVGKRGYPEEMSAEISLLSQGRTLKKKIVEINRPLMYGRLAVYIKNIQSIPVGLQLEISWNGGKSGFILTPGSSRAIQGKTVRVAAGRLDGRYGAMEIMLFENDRLLKKAWLSPYDPLFRSFAAGGYKIDAKDIQFANAGVFNVNADPGAWVVFAGLLIFILSLATHLFLRK